MSDYKIELGQWRSTAGKNPDCGENVDEDDCEPALNVTISNIYVHQNHTIYIPNTNAEEKAKDKTQRTSVRNDIALIKLEFPQIYKFNLKPICLPSVDIDITAFNVSSFGKFSSLLKKH